jgi:MOSC domain-containing protein YiiM
MFDHLRSPAVLVDRIDVRAPDEEQARSVPEVQAVAGKGLVGDRHFHPDGARRGFALTLIDAAVVAEVGLRPGETRRQLTVTGSGAELYALVGRRFRIGAIECYGVEICEPCLHLQQVTRPGILRELVHRGGINADILTDGTIAVGNPIVAVP